MKLAKEKNGTAGTLGVISSPTFPTSNNYGREGLPSPDQLICPAAIGILLRGMRTADCGKPLA